MNKSIIIFGKGPSVLKCKKEIVDEYDDIAIINYPVLNQFFLSLIKNRTINYHFANCGTFDNRYHDKTNETLNIQGVYNTNTINSVSPYKDFLKNKSIIKESIRENLIPYFKNYFDLDPNSGTLALHYILKKNIYNKILLVGFDNYEISKQTYYYKPSEYNDSIKYLLENNIITNKGEFNINSGHNPEKTLRYIKYIIQQKSNVEFNVITNNDKLNAFIIKYTNDCQKK